MQVPHIQAQINPEQQQFNDIKLGDMVPIEFSAWHWIELVTELHTFYRNHSNTGEAPVLVQMLSGKVFEALTPEEYRKSMMAELHEVQEQASTVFNPFARPAHSSYDPYELFKNVDMDDDDDND